MAFDLDIFKSDIHIINEKLAINNNSITEFAVNFLFLIFITKLYNSITKPNTASTIAKLYNVPYWGNELNGKSS